MRTLVKLAIAWVIAATSWTTVYKTISNENKQKTEEILNNQKILKKRYFDYFFKVDKNKWLEIRQNIWDCYWLASYKEISQLNSFEEIIRNNINFEFDKKNGNWYFYIKIPFVLSQNKNAWIKQKEYKISFKEASKYQLDTNWHLNSISTPTKSINTNIKYKAIAINAIWLAYLKHVTWKKIVDIRRLDWGYPENTLKTLFWEQLDIKTYYKTNKNIKNKLSKKQFFNDLVTFSKNPWLIMMGIAVHLNNEFWNYKIIKKYWDVNHAISIQYVDIKNNIIWLKDPNNFEKTIEINFDKLYKIVWSYHIWKLKKISKAENKPFKKDLRTDTSIYYSAYKETNSLNAKIENNWEKNPKLRKERWDITLTILSSKYNRKTRKFSSMKLELTSYNTKTLLILKENKDESINLQTTINWINLNINFKKNKFEFHNTISRGTRYKNKILNLIWIGTSLETKTDTDQFLYAEIAINLVHFINKHYIEKQNWIWEHPFFKSYWLVEMSNDLLIDDNISKTKRSFSKKLLSYISWLEATWWLTILEEISDLWFKTENDQKKFLEFLNKLYEKKHKKKK